MTNEREPEIQGESGRDLKIADYLTGEMNGANRAAFEQAMAADAGLAAEVDAARAVLAAVGDWIESQPPGAERADALSIPPLHAEPARVIDARPSRSSWIWQASAAAALLMLGFWAGRSTTVSPPSMNATSRNPVEPGTTQVAAPAKNESFGLNQTPAPAAGIGEQLASVPPEQAVRAVALRSVRDEDGRLVMETTLASSGVHATWVIDGEFQMAGSGSRTNQGE